MDTRVSDNLLLVTVTKVEATALLSAWEAVSGTPSKPRVINGKIYHSLGSVGGLNHFMVQSEMGTIGLGAALLTVHEGIEALSPTAVIMVGIAFGVDPSTQKIGDILVSQRIQSYEPQRLGRGLPATPKVVPRGDRASASPRLLNWFHAGDLTWKGAPVRFGLILSGEKLVDNQDFRNQLIRLEPEAIGGEMEGAGLYAAAQNSNTEWILVKAISDWADGTRDTDKIAIQENAARNAAQFVLHALSQVPLGPQAPQQQQVNTKAQNLQDLQHSGDSTSDQHAASETAIAKPRNPLERWRMYWKPITLALLVMVAVALALAPKIINRERRQPVSAPPIGSTAPTWTFWASSLSDDQIKAAIMEALHDNNVPAALNLLHDIKEAGVKDEECRHVFDFCIKNGRFEYLDALKKQCPEVR